MTRLSSFFLALLPALLLAACAKAEAGDMQAQLIGEPTQMHLAMSDQHVEFFPSDPAQSSSSSFLAADDPVLPPGASSSSSSVSSDSFRMGLVHVSPGSGGCNASFLNIFDTELTCGNAGFEFPVLYNGRCPITACIMGLGANKGFGGPLDF